MEEIRDWGGQIKTEPGTKAARRRLMSEGQKLETDFPCIFRKTDRDISPREIIDKCADLEKRQRRGITDVKRYVNRRMPENFVSNTEDMLRKTEETLRTVVQTLQEVQRRQDTMEDQIQENMGWPESRDNEMPEIGSNTGTIEEVREGHMEEFEPLGEQRMDEELEIQTTNNGAEQHTKEIEHVGMIGMAHGTDLVGMYSGRDDENLEIFLRRLEDFFELEFEAGLEDKKKALHLRGRLRGQAEAAVNGMSDLMRKDYEEIKRKLRNTFTRADQHVAAKAAIRTLEYTTFTEFIGKLVPLLRRANPEYSAETLDAMAFDIVMGKFDPKLRYEMNKMDVKNMADL